MTKFPEIVVLTTYAQDAMVYMETGEREVRPGGPGHWIEQTYLRMGVPARFITSNRTIEVVMELIKGEPLPGKVISDGSAIKVSEDLTAKGFLINHLDDFDIQQVLRLHGTVLYDIAPLTRSGEFRNQRQSVVLPAAEIRARIDIIKANDEEFPFLPPEWVEEQKAKRIFIHTLGRNGLDLWVHGEFVHFDPPKEKPKNVLGAGDTFGAAFLAHYLANGMDAVKACKEAMGEVRQLFLEKPEES